MNATTEIINILSAMGAKPIATTRNQDTTIKVNAPIINKEESKKMRYYIMLWGTKQECRIETAYNDGTVRICVPQYDYRGFYNGEYCATVEKSELITEEN